jgi:hypothetical protein
VDRRAILTGGAAALLAAIGVERLLGRDGAGGSAPEPVASPRVPSRSAPAAPPAARPSEASPAPVAASPFVLPVLCRDAWRAAPARDGLVAHQLDRMTIHHTAVPLGDNADAPARLRQHQRHHQAQGWPDIAYHLAVDRNGHVYRLRTPTAQGDTFTDYDPAGHLLILAEGHFDEQRPSDAQLDSIARLLAWGAGELGLPIDTVSGHRDHAATSCPGDALYAQVDDLRLRAHELVRGGGVETSPLCGGAGRRRVADIEAGRA